MKTKTKNLAFLLVMGLIFLLILNNNFNFGNKHNPNIVNPKESGGYTESYIHIDGSITNNWSETANDYGWCNFINGIYIIENVTIDGSSSPTGSGIFINNSLDVNFIIRNCTVYNAGSGFSDGGIKLENTNNGTLTNNNCSNNLWSGIFLDNVNNSQLIDNNCSNNDYGIFFEINCNNNTISENTANDNTWSGIYVDYYSDNNTISGNTANNNDQGIVIYEACHFNKILGNTANGNDNTGIYLDYKVDNNTFSGNTVNDNEYGILLSDTCNFNQISGNTANNNTYYGISLHWYSGFNTISDNIANYNGDIGIEIYDYSNNNTISNNIANYNGLYGIGIFDFSDNNTLTENILYNNTIGAYIDNSDNNSIYENFFLKNVKHAEDWGTDNTWNSTTIGNYWDNWTSPDVNPNDGIVDDPYTYIGGFADSIDYLPIAEDGAPRITIKSPSSGNGFSITAPSFDVEITDIYVFSRWYTLDGGLQNYTFTKNGIINQSAWDALADGAATLKFYASDIVGKIGSAEVSIIKDTVAPVIIINSPTEGERFGKNAPLFNITVTEDNLDVLLYSFDGGSTTYAFTNNTVFNQTAWTELSEGDVTITFYARDIAGNEATEDVIVIKSVPSGLDLGMIITIVLVSVIGGVAVISVVYIFMKKRITPV